jgi:hypothetical protein
MTFNLTTFDSALQAKLNSASLNQSAQDYLLLTKAVQAAISVSEGVNLIDLKGTANGVAGLDANSQVPAINLVNALPSQSGNSGKILSTNGTLPSWSNTVTLASIASTDLSVSGTPYIGTGAAAFESAAALTDAAMVINTTGGANSFGQIAFRNSTPTSSTDIIAYMDNGDDTEGWVGIGIAGSTFDDTTYGITAPGDGYIFHNTKSGNGRNGNLVIATGDAGDQNKLVFAAGGFASGDTQMSITPASTGVDGNVHIETPTTSVSPTTGALTVVGGVGISGDMNIQGDVSIQGTITFGGGGTTVETSNLAVTDPAVFVGTNNQADIVDLAFIGEYAVTTSAIVSTVSNKSLTSNVATLTTTSNHTYLAGDVVTVTGVDATFNGVFNIISVPTATTFTYAKTASNVTSSAVSPTGTATVNARRKFAGIARDASDGVIKAFKDATTKPSSTINFAEAGLSYSDVRVGGLTASSLTVGNISDTELSYLDGVTSSIQTQINSKISTATAASTYAPLLQPIESSRTFTTNNYNLQSGDKDKVVLLSNGTTAGTITVPANVFNPGETLTVVQTGSGQLTLTQSGTTLNSQGNKLKLNGQYSSAQLVCTATNTFLVIGNLAV